MGRIFPQTYLRWREPAEARRAREALASPPSPLLRPALVLLAVGVVVLGWWLNLGNPNRRIPGLPVVLILGLLLGLVHAYGVPLLLRVLPSYLVVNANCIARLVGNTGRNWRYENIQLCEIVRQEGIVLLRITDKRSNCYLLGVAPSISLERLQQILCERGVAVRVT